MARGGRCIGVGNQVRFANGTLVAERCLIEWQNLYTDSGGHFKPRSVDSQRVSQYTVHQPANVVKSLGRYSRV